LLTIRRM